MENILLDIKYFYVCNFYFAWNPPFERSNVMIVEKEPMPLMTFIKKYGIPKIGFNRQLLDMLICNEMINTNVAIVAESNSVVEQLKSISIVRCRYGTKCFSNGSREKLNSRQNMT